MKVWITSFLLLFGAAELFQWAKEMTLPMPIFVLGGAFLAIASNYDKLTNLPFHLDYQAPDSTPKQMPASQAPPVVPKSAAPRTAVRESVSFEIQKPFKPGD